MVSGRTLLEFDEKPYCTVNQVFTPLPTALYRADQVRELDRRAIEDHGIAGYTLMSRAGAAVQREALRRWPAARRAAVVCGVGNNAGDGFVVARLLAEAGLDVEVYTLAPVERLRGDARTAFEAMVEAGITPVTAPPVDLAGCDFVVDAMFGTGLDREVSGHWAETITALNAAPVPVIAVDIPSGLHADRGVPLNVAVQAVCTVSFIGLKVGMLTAAGPAFCGSVCFDDLGVPAAVYEGITPAARRCVEADLARVLRPRRRDAHKGQFGHVVVVGGNVGMAGAVRLAGEAALRSGAGLVTVATRAAHVGGLLAGCPELMVQAVEPPRRLATLLNRASVVVVGPGLGQDDWSRACLQACLESGRPLVVDADALNLLAYEPLCNDHWILTPHPGEAARLLGLTVGQIQNDRFAALQALSESYRGVVVLKGAGTLIQAGLECPPWLADCGNPGMATAGMGDVLSGVIGALVAQGHALAEAAWAGVVVHGAAGDLAARRGERGLTAGEVTACLRAVVNPGGG